MKNPPPTYEDAIALVETLRAKEDQWSDRWVYLGLVIAALRAHLKALAAVAPSPATVQAPAFIRGDDVRNETCLACGRHISRHYGGTEYRCNPRQDPCPRCKREGCGFHGQLLDSTMSGYREMRRADDECRAVVAMNAAAVAEGKEGT